MNRRSLASLLIGILAAVAGLSAAGWLRQRRCIADGGRWDAAARLCFDSAGLPSSESTGDLVRVYFLAALVAVMLAVMLWRIYLFATGARAPRRPR